MAEIVNLRQARKKKLRSEKERRAEENRAKFGRAKTEKQRTAAEADHDSHQLDQVRLIPDE
jgi:hypothetical protein